MQSFPIVFVRHAESESNVHLHTNHPDAENLINEVGDPKITQRGVQQAQQTAKHITGILKNTYSDQKVTVMLSAFQRTMDTFSELSKVWPEMPIETIKICKDLNEYTSTKKQLSETDKKRGLFHDESWDAFLLRVKSFVDKELLTIDSPTIIFAHSLWISAAVSYLSSQRRYLPHKNELSFCFPNCSITVVRIVNGVYKIECSASVAHLSSSVITGSHTDFGTNFNIEQ